MVNVTGILETALYVDDLARSAAFYQSLFGFAQLVVSDRLIALAVHDWQVLLLFRKGSTTETAVLPGGTIPPHDGNGRLHFAFAISAAELDVWRDRLHSSGVAIEGEVKWPRGGTSLYFRDPDAHLVELATPGLWSTY